MKTILLSKLENNKYLMLLFVVFISFGSANAQTLICPADVVVYDNAAPIGCVSLWEFDGFIEPTMSDGSTPNFVFTPTIDTYNGEPAILGGGMGENTQALWVTDDGLSCIQNIYVASLDDKGDIEVPFLGCQSGTYFMDCDFDFSCTATQGSCSDLFDWGTNTVFIDGSPDVIVTDSIINLFTGEEIQKVIRLLHLEDNNAPVVICPENMTFPADGNSCQVSLNDLGDIFVSDCSEFTISNNFQGEDVAIYNEAGDLVSVGTSVILNVGQNWINWHVVDANGLFTDCTSLITVTEEVAPTVVCNNVTVSISNDSNPHAWIDASDIVTASDNCSDPTIVISQQWFNCNNIGDNTVIVTATDASGNQSSCESVVTVIDDTSPSISCPGDITIPANSDCTVNQNPSIGQASATDNCETNLTTSISNNPTYVLGSNTVVWQIDQYPDIVCTQVVTITSPDVTVDCPSTVEVNVDAGICTASNVDLGTPTVNGDCLGNVVMTNDAPPVFPVGTTTVIWTDGAGLTCMQNVLVIDNINPTAICQSISVDLGPSGSITITASQIDNGSFDNCGDVTISISPSTFDCSNIGDNTVVLTVTDQSNNTSSCEATVTVTGNSVSGVTCPDDITLEANNDGCTAIGVDLGAPVIEGNCGVANLNANNDAPAVFGFGSTTVNWTVTDDAGTVLASCSQVVNVVDNTNPVIVCPPSVTVQTVGDATTVEVTVPTATATDQCGILSIEYSYNGLIGSGGITDNFPIGTTTITWIATDNNGNTSECTMTVTVVDNTGAEVNCAADVTASAGANCDALVTVGIPVSINGEPITFTNDYNNTANASDTYPIGTTTVIWTILDANGNSSSCTTLVTVLDDTAPEVICPAATITAEVNTDGCVATGVVLGTPVVTGDNCGNVDMVINNDAPTEYIFGTTTTVTWTISDASGNVTTCIQNVTVEDNNVQSITCPSSVTVQTIGDATTAEVTVPAATATDQCGISSIEYSYNGLIGSGDITDNFPVGTTTITWIATDNNGNTTDCTMTVTVVDNTGAPVDCAADVIANATANCEAFVTVDVPVATSSEVITYVNNYNGTADASDTYPVGVTTVIWTITDASGNISSCNTLITVLDTSIPTITCPTDMTVEANEDGCVAIGIDLGTPTVGDDCDDVSDLVITNNAVEPYIFGSTTVIWTVVDPAGNTETCSQVITVEDNTAPVITCPENIVVETVGDETTVSVPVPTATATDVCGVATIEYSYNGLGGSGAFTDDFPVGTTTITWTATDIHGNISDCTMTVTVVDNTGAPVDCAADVIANATANCEAFVTVDVPVATSSEVITYVNNYNGTANASDTYPVGVTTVIWTITDASGNISSCNTLITVLDTSIPTITCPSDMIVEANEDGCVAIGIDLGAPTVGDDCDDVSDLVITNNAVEPYGLGSTTVIWTVVDPAGNTETCSQVITVEDNTAPVITCPPSVTVETVGNETTVNVTVPTATATDVCGVSSVTYAYNGLEGLGDITDDFPIGTTTIVWTAIDNHGNIEECYMTVTVEDHNGPELECPDDVSAVSSSDCDQIVNVDHPESINGESITYTNDYNGTDDASDTYPVGETLVVWTVTDISGNISICNTIVTIIDNTAPVVDCPQDITADTDSEFCSADIFIDNIVASDDCGIESILSDVDVVAGEVNTFTVGTTTINWTITDVNGNESTCTQIVTVTDAEAPTIECQAITLNYDNDIDECGANITDIVSPVVDDNCGIASVTNDYNSTDDANDFYPVGTTVLTWSVTDNGGNTSTCSTSIIISDIQTPVIECPDTMFVNSNSGACEADVVVPQPTVNDNCTFTLLNDFTGTDDASGTYEGGENASTTVQWTITDASGNTATCSQVITVVDNEAPVINCPGDIFVDNDPGECGAIVEYGDIIFSDNCGVDSITLVSGYVSGVYMPVGDTTIVYEVIDFGGNSAICEINVTVQDVESPTIICANDTLIIGVSQVVEYAEIEFYDNCDATLTLLEGMPSGSVFPHCVSDIVWQVMDNYGNSAECTFTITINQPPVALDDIITIEDPGSEVVILPLENDSDPDGDPNAISWYVTALGDAVQADDSTLIYNAPEDWCGITTIDYEICNSTCDTVFPLCDQATIFLNVVCPEDLFIPEGFSPDGDGSNDTFEIIGLDQYPGNMMQIYNRWGHIVFEADDYDGNWDGTSIDDMRLGSDKLPRGTYYYLLDLGNGSDPIKGFVYILN